MAHTQVGFQFGDLLKSDTKPNWKPFEVNRISKFSKQSNKLGIHGPKRLSQIESSADR